MASASYENKLKTINVWVDIVNTHWIRLNGVLNNDKEFWADALHDVPAEVWWHWVDIAPSLAIQYEDEYRRYNWNDIDIIKKRLMLGDPITKKHRKDYNFPAFRALMNIKDFMNDINNVNVVVEEPEEEPTQFEKLFVFGELYVSK